MTNIVIFNEDEIRTIMVLASEADANHRELRLVYPHGKGVAFKVGQSTWTAPIGKVEK